MGYTRRPYGLTGYDSSPYTHMSYGLSTNLDGLVFYEPLLNSIGGGTFTRASPATYVDGLLKTAASGEPRFESGYVTEGRTNLILRSEEFDQSPWVLPIAGDAVDVDVIANPLDGDKTADGLVSDATSGGHRLRQNPVVLGTTGGTLILSVYAQRGANDWCQVKVTDTASAGDGFRVWFNLDSGVVGSTLSIGSGTFITALIEPVSGGWWRCSIVGVASPTATQARCELFTSVSDASDTSTGDGVSVSTYFYGAQVELPANNTALYPSPYASDRNRLTYTEDFGNAAWAKSSLIVGGDAIVAPDGTLSGDKITEAATASNHVASQACVIDGTRPVTVSVFAKAAERNWFRVVAFDGADFGRAWFDLASGTIGSSGVGGAASGLSVEMESQGNGWFRCVVTVELGGTTTATTGCYVQRIDGETSGYLGDGVSGLYVWGAQAEVGASPTTYVPTTDGTVYTPGINLPDAPREVRTNLIEASQNFDDALWVDSNGVSAGNVAESPKGTGDAGSFTSDTVASTIHYTRQNVVITAASTLACSVYLKRTNTDWLYLFTRDAGSNNGFRAWFNVATGEVGTTDTAGTGTLISASIEPDLNGYYRCSIVGTISAAGTAAQFRIAISGGDGDVTIPGTPSGTESFLLWGAQLEEASTAGPYYQTFATARTFSFAPNPAPQGYLSEGERENLVTFAEQFDGTDWTSTRASVSANAIVAPDGTLTADKLVEDSTAGSTHNVAQSVTVGGSDPVTMTVFARAGERNWVRLVEGNTVTAGAFFDLANGEVGNVAGTGSPSAVIELAPNGFWRCSLTFTPAGATVLLQVQLADGDGPAGNVYSGDGTSGVYLWGAQAEEGAFASSYIPTQAIAVTRAQDFLTYPFSTLTEGSTTHVADHASAANNEGFEVSIGDDNINYIGTAKGNSGSIENPSYTVWDGVNRATGNTAVDVYLDNVPKAIALTYIAGDSRFYTSGVFRTSGTPASLPTQSILRVGGQVANGDRPMYGHINTVKVYNRVLGAGEV